MRRQRSRQKGRADRWKPSLTCGRLYLKSRDYAAPCILCADILKVSSHAGLSAKTRHTPECAVKCAVSQISFELIQGETGLYTALAPKFATL